LCTFHPTLAIIANNEHISLSNLISPVVVACIQACAVTCICEQTQHHQVPSHTIMKHSLLHGCNHTHTHMNKRAHKCTQRHIQTHPTHTHMPTRPHTCTHTHSHTCLHTWQVAKLKVQERGWKNVHVVESDACTFSPPEGSASLVTFSYSLSSACRHYYLG